MFGDLMGNVQKQQEELQKKLKEIPVSYSEAGFIIEMNALKEVKNIDFPNELLSKDRKEELTDLLIMHVNRAMALADTKSNEVSASALNDMLPGGLGGLFGS